MAVTTTRKRFLKRLASNFPEIRFVSGAKFAFRSPRTVVLGPEEPNDALLALHEVGHALCGHRNFSTHVERIKIEAEAWERAKALCAEFGVAWDEGFVEAQMDTYRDWLHAKSRCRECGLTRYQTPDGEYHCPRCDIIEV